MWTEGFGNASSEALRRAWKQKAQVYQQHIQSDSNEDQRKQWTALQFPTGSGKTTGTILYCSMLSTELPPEDHPGVLIITRLKREADGIAEGINQRAGNREVACSYHSDKRGEVTLDELRSYPVLIITHRAYEIALDHLGQGSEIHQTWPFYHDYSIGKRKLVIVDEVPELVEHSRGELNDLNETLGAIPYELEQQYPDEVYALQLVVKYLKTLGSLDEMKSDRQASMLPDIMSEAGTQLDFEGLRKALLKTDRHDDPDENKRIRDRHDERLKSLQFLLRSWLYYSKIDNKHTLHTARLLIPEDVKGAVILDATAGSNVLYELVDNIHVLEPPAGVRDYSNVTLYVSRGHRVGKRYMERHAKSVSKALLKEMTSLLSQDDDLFIACHKSVQPHLIGYSTPFKLSVGHWGRISGLNDWKDSNRFMVFGLPYKPGFWSSNVYMACQGPQDSDWLNSDGDRPHGNHKDVRRALKTGQMVVEIVQAINRTQCRKTIDELGNCPHTEGYILLPSGDLANEILAGIRREMPSIRILEGGWEYGSQKRVKVTARRSKPLKSLLSYLECMRSGDVITRGTIMNELGIAHKTMNRLIKKIRDGADPDITQMLDDWGVRYEVRRAGKSSTGYFIRD